MASPQCIQWVPSLKQKNVDRGFYMTLEEKPP